MIIQSMLKKTKLFILVAVSLFLAASVTAINAQTPRERHQRIRAVVEKAYLQLADNKGLKPAVM